LGNEVHDGYVEFHSFVDACTKEEALGTTHESNSTTPKTSSLTNLVVLLLY
jgi:hypothetical protein